MGTFIFLSMISLPFPDLVQIPIPYELAVKDFMFGRSVYFMTCDRAMEVPLLNALRCVAAEERRLGKRLLKTYGGCHVHRKIQGTDRWSQHAHGLAVDINVPANASRYINLQPPELVKCFENAGFEWGGRWMNKDYMHMQLLITYEPI